MKATLQIVLCLVIVGTTLAFGGVQPRATSAMELILFLLVFFFLLKRTSEGRIELRLPRWPLFFALWVALQLLPLPRALVGQVAPGRLWDQAASGPTTGRGAWVALSIYPHATLASLVEFLAYLCAFFLASYCHDSRKRRSILLQALIGLGFFEAAYGTVQFLTRWQWIFTYKKKYSLQMATGTFINYNHFAGLLELIIPFAVSMALYRYAERPAAGRENAARSPAAKNDRGGPPAIFYAFLATSMAVAVVFSHSRTGILATLLTLAVIVTLAAVKATGKTSMLFGLAFLLGVTAYALWMGMGPVLGRFEQMAQPGYLQLEGRLGVWRDALCAARGFPLVGSGLGTSALAIRPCQTVFVNNLIDHVHNDYLELAIEAGLPGALLLFVPIFCLEAKMIAAFLTDTDRFRPWVTLGCAGGTLSLLIHSLTDFNLHIPSNALALAVVLGVGFKTAIIERREEDGTGAAARSRRPKGDSFTPSRGSHSGKHAALDKSDD